MVWPFGRRKRRIRRAERQYRQASAELRRATTRSRLFGRRDRAIRRATRQFEKSSDELRKLDVLEIDGAYPRNWDTLRRLVYARDRHRCTNCGRKGGRRVELHAHHVIPLSRGGTNTLDNLVTLCRDCHRLAHRRRPPLSS
jgi:5-methylcytosine-specific restriction endonuclease McrA